MFLKKFDALSPSIGLYYNEEKQHSSVFSGVLSIIVFAVIVMSEIYHVSFIGRKLPKTYFFNKNIEDAGNFPVNASSMFNFIQLVNRDSNEEIEFDFSYLSVLGFDDVYSNQYIKSDFNIDNQDHYWIYGYCNNNSDTEGISNLINFKYFEKSACIRKYYDKKQNRYFETGEEGFRWPIIEKGCSHPKRTYYGIIIQKCTKSNLYSKGQGPECKTETQITNFIKQVSLKYQLMDHYADMLNYEKPFTKFFQTITGDITEGTYASHNLNFNPANLYSYDGYFFENKVEETSYFYTKDDKETVETDTTGTDNKTKGCLIAIYFWMQNTLQHYERVYDRIQDILANIGGVCYVFVSIASIINIIVNKFITILDTEDFIVYPNQVQKESSFVKRGNEKMYPPKKSSAVQNKQANKDVDQMSSNDQNSAKELHLGNRKDGNNEITNMLKGTNNFNIGSQNNENNVAKHNIKNNPEASINDKSLIKYSRNKLYEGNEKTCGKTFSLFFNYIWYLIKCKKDYPKFNYYEKFRAKLISEENIVQCYFDILQISKINNIEKISLFENTNN